MNFQSYEKTDRRILSIALLLLMLSTLLLWQDSWIYQVVQTRRSNLEKIGEVHTMDNDVRRRLEIALSWLPLRKSNDIFQGDSIFTGNNSTVVIETKNGERISISPNSLVVINQKKDSISLDIGFGSVESQINTGRKLFISSNNSLTEIAGNNGSVRIDSGEGNNLLLSVLGGEVKVRSADGEKLFRIGEASRLLGNGTLDDPNKPNIQLIGPSAEQKFKIDDEKPIVFSWATPRKFSRMKIKVSPDPSFSNPIVDTRIDDNSFSAYNLPKDTELYWQVIAEGGISKIQKFAIVGNRPPVPVLPKPGYQFFFNPFLATTPAGSDVELLWEQGSPATHFEVQLAANTDFTKRLVEKKIKDKKLKFKLLEAGQYYWRVRSIDFPDQAWSAPSMFKVGPEPTKLLASPLSQMASNTFLIPTKIHGMSANKIHSLRMRGAQKYIEKFPLLNWSTIAEADRYTIDISRNKKFTDSLVSQTVPRSFYTWRFIEPGTYYWRSKGLSENFKDGLYSQVQELKIGIEAPRALSKSLIVDEVPDQLLLNAPPPPLSISWNPTVFTKSYEIEFATTSDFTSSTKFISNQSSKEIQIPKPGIYFWRIRALDNNKVPVSPFSMAYTLEFQRIYKDPIHNSNLLAIYPKQQDSIILVGTAKSEIEFKWTKPYADAEYRIELSYNPDFEFVFYSGSTKENYLKYTEMFQGRIVYWRVRAEKKDFVTEWSGANRFLVAYEGRPFDFEQSDLMFASRLKAKDRQLEILAAQKRRLAQLRTPASALELQLDTPQLIDPPSEFLIESNLDPNISPEQLVKLPFDKFYPLVRSQPIIRWNKVAAAERYVIEIAKDAKFEQTVTKAPVWNPFFNWDTARPGKFYYRVQAFNDRYKRSNFTHPKELLLTVASLAPTSPDTHVEVYGEPKDMWQPPNPLTLSWSPAVFARAYEIEFSENQTFNLAKVYKTSKTTIDIRVPRTGLYYWRVRPISDNGIGIALFSPIRSIEVIQTDRKPASVNQLTALFPVNRTMLFVGEGLMNLAFQWLSPDGLAPSEIEVSDSKNFSRIISKSNSQTGKTVISNDLPEGKIYWRVRSGSMVSEVSEFYLRRERKPYSPEANASLAP